MIIARAPLRVSLAGGGTDLPWFESNPDHDGSSLIATSIDKYVTVMVKRRRWDSKIRVAYSKDEIVDSPHELEHPLLREVLSGSMFVDDAHGLEVHTMADVPANTGLGSSGAFVVALVAALHALQGDRYGADTIAGVAFEFEKRVDPNTGWQDHYIAAYGGTRWFRAGASRVRGLTSNPLVRGLESLELWFTGTKRKACDVLGAQAESKNLSSMAMIGALVKDVVTGTHIGEVLDRHHQLKISTAPAAMTTGEIEQHVDAARRAGARGVKLVGAGGGGFLLVSMPDVGSVQVRMALEKRGLQRLPVTFGVPGVEVLRW